MKFHDPKWEEAECRNEKDEYYWFYMYGGGRCVKKYKPSIAHLVHKRTNLEVIPVFYERR